MSPKKNGGAVKEKKARKAAKKAWRRARPRGAPWVMPILWSSDPRALAEVYERAFGFELRGVFPPDGPADHVEMRHRGRGLVMISRPEAFGERGVAAPTGPSNVTQYVYVASVDALVERARAAGMTIITEPEDAFWGDRIARLRDPAGHTWMFATHARPGRGEPTSGNVHGEATDDARES